MKATNVMLDSFDRVHEIVKDILEGIDDGALTARPTCGTSGKPGNSIAWLIWHLARVEDAQIADAFAAEQVWTTDDFVTRFNLDLPKDDTGYGHGSDAVDKVRASAKNLSDYYDAVHVQTVKLLTPLADGDFDRIIDDSWDPAVTPGARLISTISDCLQHAGQAAYAKGLVG